MRRWRWALGALAIIVVADVSIVYQWRRRDREARYDEIIAEASRRYDVSPSLIKAVIWHESGFDEKALGGVGEIGLMQLRALSASEWAAAEGVSAFAHEHVQHPRTNILAGSWYLKKMLTRYNDTDNPLPYALADYNAGRTHVLRWAKGEGATNSQVFFHQIDFPGTQNYLRSVIGRYLRYRGN